MNLKDNEVLHLIGKPVVFSKEWTPSGDFGAVSKAEKWCKENGISVGSMCRNEPIGLVEGSVSIAKWRNIDREEYERLDGLMLSEDFREGGVRIVLFAGTKVGG